MIKINEKVSKLVSESEKELDGVFRGIDDVCEYNSMKVLSAFNRNNVSESHFISTTGYGYNDIGRDVIERVYSDIFKSEDALVRTQIISGTHALTVTLFALLRPDDVLLSISGKPYDTLDEVIGITDNDSSLKSYGIRYEQIDLIDNNFDYEMIEKRLRESFIKVIEIQRSKGYSTRKSIGIEKLEKVIKLIKSVSPNTIVMVDNCYCEFVDKIEPIEVGADVAVGSLIKNLGGGIASNGGYIVGKRNLIELCAERLNVPGEGKEVGPTMGMNKSLLMGLFFSPKVVTEAVKIAVLTSMVLEKLGYDVEPKWNDKRVDIVQNIIFNDKEKLIKYCEGLQGASPIDSNVLPIPSPMPGYNDMVIMASGSFTQGSSIELSCDAPLRSPYILYQQGGLTYQYGNIGICNAISRLED